MQERKRKEKESSPKPIKIVRGGNPFKKNTEVSSLQNGVTSNSVIIKYCLLFYFTLSNHCKKENSQFILPLSVFCTLIYYIIKFVCNFI